MKPQPGQRILDLGGTTGIWRFVDIPLHITVLNLESQEIDEYSYGDHNFVITRGDATKLSHFTDQSFDIVFSNSCIEHVGPPDKQEAFAQEARRLAPAYYIQTPAKTFPIEAHTGLPFWWYYPAAMRRFLICRWQSRRAVYGDFVDGTRVLTLRKLKQMFPDGKVLNERVLGLVKSHTMWRRPE